MKDDELQQRLDQGQRVPSGPDADAWRRLYSGLGATRNRLPADFTDQVVRRVIEMRIARSRTTSRLAAISLGSGAVLAALVCIQLLAPLTEGATTIVLPALTSLVDLTAAHAALVTAILLLIGCDLIATRLPVGHTDE